MTPGIDCYWVGAVPKMYMMASTVPQMLLLLLLPPIARCVPGLGFRVETKLAEIELHKSSLQIS